MIHIVLISSKMKSIVINSVCSEVFEFFTNEDLSETFWPQMFSIMYGWENSTNFKQLILSPGYIKSRPKKKFSNVNKYHPNSIWSKHALIIDGQ